MTTVKKYRVWCTIEEVYVETWSADVPAVCPNNNTHAIDIGITTIIDTVKNAQVSVIEETTPTGGYYMTDCLLIEIPDIPVYNHDFSYPISINVLDMFFTVNAENIGDNIDVLSAPDTVVGALTANANPSDTVLNVSSTVTDNIKVGFDVDILDAGTGANDDLGRVIAVNKASGTITVENPVVNLHNASGPTYVRMTIYRFKNFQFLKEWKYEVGLGKIGSSYLPAGVTVRIRYNNVSGGVKRMPFYLEYLY